MAQNTPDYPTTIWDKTSPSRDSISIDRSPDMEDWEQISAEVQAMQKSLIGSTDPDTVGNIPVIHKFVVPNGAGNVDIILTHKTRVIEAWAVKTAANGGAGDTVQVFNGASAITNALDLNVTDTTVVRATTINDANHEVAAGGTLRVTSVDMNNPSSIVYVMGIRVP